MPENVARTSNLDAYTSRNNEMNGSYLRSKWRVT